MSDATPGDAYDATWAASVAATRGVELGAARAQELAVTVGATLRRFAVIADEMEIDDDAYEFRRLIAAEALRHG